MAGLGRQGELVDEICKEVGMKRRRNPGARLGKKEAMQILEYIRTSKKRLGMSGGE